VPAGIRTTYRTVRCLIHVYVLYSFILFLFLEGDETTYLWNGERHCNW